ncbi:prolyl oligopeptidase family serine peptidase [Paucibacter sp. APW11]|uniref:Prolyl oligopeptidase family serine peptidase n=1 Tax=Roseateles aquae TaxID=3077235 RepID=A0ABU3PBU6_9BURK|nr:prolyl oligopeptidase family serine peptidase [Paucibacter sp. APW11]MDT9000039.1 prolyl oligopeptidase family serine peptidase [Paucibacter sp. APW11]
MRQLLLLLPLCGLLHSAPLLAQPVNSYQQPAPAVRELLDTPAQPRLLIAPDKQTVALLELRRFSSAEELARPTLRLAGTRFDVASSGPTGVQGVQKLRLRSLLNAEAPERNVELPAGGLFHDFAWAPDGQRFVLHRRTEQGTELWVGEVATARLRAIPGIKLNEVLVQDEQAWLNPRELIVTVLPERRGAAPQQRLALAPVVQESIGRASPERTHPDLLKTPLDEALFEYHARSQLAWVDIASGASRELGAPALFSSVSSVGEGQYLLTERVLRPFSYTLPWDDFPTVVELRHRDGRLLRELTRMPMRSGVAIDGVLAGPRVFYASPFKDAAVYWIEALDGGNPNTRVAFRDRVMRLDPPYTGEPMEVQRMPHRFARLRFLDDGQHALLSEIDRQRAWTRTYLLPLRGSQSKPLFEHSLRERYRHPGNPLMRTLANGAQVVQSQGGAELLMAGVGASARGDRPFLDRWSLKDLSVQRLFQSSETHYEMPQALLDDGRRLLTLRESASEPPNLVLREGQVLTPLTKLRDNQPQLRKVRRELVNFKRADGVEMSFWMYLPPDYKEGERRPTLVWAYPLEYSDAAIAGQVSGSINRYNAFSGISPLLLLQEGFVVLYDATMPIVGDLKTLNDGFIEQITMNARAIIDKAEDLGVSDPKRMAVGGHSYGAFMAVNLLAHTDLFKAGVARSGAYNRTLTPFGFQSERRSLWEARDVYLRLSPLLYAHQIKEALLLIHGEADNNAGTQAFQSERLYQAIAGLGGTVRYVLLPNEAHGYTARESAGHVQWEMSQWLKAHLGDPHAGP